MNSISKIVLGAMLASTLFTSCKDKKQVDPEPPKPKTAQEMLTAKSWKMSASTSKFSFMGQNFTENIMDEMEVCEKDNLEKYNANGTFTNDEGATKCDANDPQIYESGTWQLLENNTKLKRINNKNETATFDVVSLNETTLKLKIVENMEFPNPTNPNQNITVNVTVEVTLTAQ